MSESFDDQLSRVELMAAGDPTWDLSPNDLAALQAVLAEVERLRAHTGSEGIAMAGQTPTGGRKDTLFKAFAAKIAAEHGLTILKSQDVVWGVFEQVISLLEEGERVRLPGFGTFTPKLRAARRARDVYHNVPIFVKEKMMVRFKPAPSMAKRVAEAARERAQ